MSEQDASARPVPAAVAAQIAHQFGKDCVIVIAINHEHGLSHTTVYGRSPRDKGIAQALGRAIERFFADEVSRITQDEGAAA